MKSLLLLLSGMALLAGCASTPSLVCEPDNARQAGMAQALLGKPMDAAEGKGCKSNSNFQENFRLGYEVGKKKFCDPANVESHAMADGRAGRTHEANDFKYSICDNQSDLVASYDRAYKKGLESYCTDTQFKEAGTVQGERGLPQKFSADQYQVCGENKIQDFKVAYEQGYKEGLGRFCGGKGVEDQAFKEGSEGFDRSKLSEKYSLCSDDERLAVQALYDKSYEHGLNEFCSPAGVEREAKKRAQMGDAPEFPENFNICLAKNPDVKVQYPEFFKNERRRFVESHCTRTFGLAQGQRDAEATNDIKLGLPAFCDYDNFASYKEGYMEGWKMEKDRLCDVVKAYDQGVSDGRHRRDQSFRMPSQCPPDVQALLRKKYGEGYLYAKNQPILEEKGDDSGFREVSTYSPKEARKACEEKFKDNKNASDLCDGVTSKACIEKGNPPFRCKITTKFMTAVDACFNHGFSPAQCHKVKDLECIQAGKNPFLCENPPTLEN
jgi:hypothetical protein